MRPVLAIVDPAGRAPRPRWGVLAEAFDEAGGVAGGFTLALERLC